jgi:4-amino-4-deoxy-L-arabinose transferase-like glycosyltransferase
VNFSNQPEQASEAHRIPGFDGETSGSSDYLRGRLVRPTIQLALIFFAGLFIYCLWLGNSPLDRTEPFRALVAHQMVHGSSWLVPHLYGELYQRKPPLIYWIEAAAEIITGRGTEWVWRAPSAVGSALLAVFIAWWSARWFGASARLPAGFSCLALVALWDQNRGADIDALNTVMSLISTLCVLELLYGLGEGLGRVGRQTAGWTLGLGVAIGATLLLKGPGGLPQILGAVFGPALIMKDWSRARRPGVWVGFLVGFAIFSVYIVAAKLQMQHTGTVADKTGWYEIIEKIFFHDWKQRLIALLMPMALLAYALPVSAVLPLAFIAIRRSRAGDVERQRAIALLATLGAGLFIWVLDGNDNPRYEYVMLPLLSPIAGFVWTRRRQFDRQLMAILIGVCVILFAGNLFISLKAFHIAAYPHVLLSGLIAAGLLLFIAIIRPRCSSMAGIALLLLFALPMAERKNAERRRKSAMVPAAKLREVIGNAARVSAAGVVRDMPELFYYAGVDVDSYGEFGLSNLVANASGHWIVISQAEKPPAYSTIMKEIPGALTRVTKLPMPDPRDVIYVGWYDPPPGENTHFDWHVEKHADADE